MPGQIILTQGIPGSGKTTWAREQWRKDPKNVIIVERDEIRTTLFGDEYHKRNPDNASENKVTAIQEDIVKRGIREGKTVIISDTHTNPRIAAEWAKKAVQYGVPIRVEQFDVDPEECKRRTKARGAAGGREVPEHVMDRMIASAYDNGRIKDLIVSKNGAWLVSKITPGGKKLQDFSDELNKKYPLPSNSVVIVDVDGTLSHDAHIANAAFGKPGAKKDYAMFFRGIEHAPVNEGVVELANRMRNEENLGIVVLTGRDDHYARELVSFLERSGIQASRVLAKRSGDYRPDVEFKIEAVQKLMEDGLIPVHAIDDRARSVAIWEKMGLQVSRVDEHIPEDPATAPESYPMPKVNTIYGSGHCIRCGSPLKSGGNLGPSCRKKVG